MKKINLFLIVLLAAGAAFGQGDNFYFYRRYNLTPPYDSSRVRQLVLDVIRRSKDGFIGGAALSNPIYASLTLREKFTYNMAYPEAYSQNCSLNMDPPQAGNMLFAQLPMPFSDYLTNWSSRQYAWFKANRDSVVALIRDCASTGDHLGLNVKYVILEVGATALIPFLIDTYRMHRKDHDILTVLMILMNENNYQPFLQSALHGALYAGKESSYRTAVPLTTHDENLILRLAGEFYKH